MGVDKQRQRGGLQVQREPESSLYTKGDGHQEVIGEVVSVKESAVQKSVMSHTRYRKRKEGENRNSSKQEQDARRHAPQASGPVCQSCDARSHVIHWGHARGWQATRGGNGET